MSEIVTSIVEKLHSKVVSYIGDQFEFESDIQEKLEHLKEDLIQIQAVLELEDADGRKIENANLKKWLLSLKDAVYSTMQRTYLTCSNMKFFNMKLRGKFTTLRRILNRAPRIRIKLFNDHLNKFNHVVETFKKIVDKKGDMMKLIILQPTIRSNVSELMKSRETTSEPIEREMFGRDNERSKLMELVGKSSSTKNVSVLSIVGMGGMGKTTLVQDVYKQVKHQFDLHAWVCVSDNFDVKRLVREIMESASISIPPEFHNLENLDRITNILRSGLTGKKFLIVLDDIWGEEKTEWEKLQRVLNIGKEGSRVIITTRFKNIAEMMETKDEAIITLGGLADDKFWKLFSHYAFRDENPANRAGLERIGIQIAEKLGGNPLAAKTVGALLSCNLKIPHWREVFKKWQTYKKEDGIMSALELSYDYLPSHFKQCFIFCSVFPKDYSYQKDQLIRLWRAHEYLSPNDGEAEFNELVSRSFIQESFSGENRGYVIHDLLHDLAQSLSDGEIFSMDNKDSIIPERVRHISIHAHNLSLVSTGMFAKENLRSLVVFGSDHINISFDFLSALEGLRVLVVYHFDGNLSSKSFDKMLHLRYLDMHSSVDLPESICKLYHMQYLHLSRCALWSKDINKLINLSFLGDQHKANMRKIAWIGKLTLLESLYFNVNQNMSGFEISQLSNMTQLTKLETEGLESVKSKEDAREAMLGNKQHLKSLKLHWSVDDDDSSGGAGGGDDVLEDLQPHEYLEELTIEGYRGNTPDWWKGNWTSYLRKITLRGLKWEFLPPMGQLPSLEELYLECMNEVKRIGREFYGMSSGSTPSSSTTILFPSLKVLYMFQMSELTGFVKVEDDGLKLFPCLFRFEISVCPKLRGSLFSLQSQFLHLIPNLSTLQQLQITKCDNIESLPEEGLPTSLHKLEIYKCEKLKSLPEHGLLATSLQELQITWCNNIESLPEEGLPTSLQILRIEHCEKLKSLPEHGLLDTSLQELRIDGCNNIESLPEEGLPTSLQILRIVDCKKLKSLPEHGLLDTSLQELIIYGSDNIESLPEEGLPTSLQILRIVKCKKLKSLPEHGLLDTSLQELRIDGSDNIESLPEEGLPTSLQILIIFLCKKLKSLPEHGLLATSLQELEINQCDNIESLPEEGLPTSLQELRIDCCPLLEEACRKEWHKIAHIPTIRFAGRTVQGQRYIWE